MALEQYEARLARQYGFARKGWELSKTLGAALATSLLAIVVPLAQIGGAL